MNGKRSVLAVLALSLWSAAAWAGGTLYIMRVDGLACPYCAYGVEQKLEKIEGVRDESIDIDLNKGLVRVEVSEGVHLTEAQMEKLFHEAGLTFRDMERKPL